MSTWSQASAALLHILSFALIILSSVALNLNNRKQSYIKNKQKQEIDKFRYEDGR